VVHGLAKSPFTSHEMKLILLKTVFNGDVDKGVIERFEQDVAKVFSDALTKSGLRKGRTLL